MIQWFVKKNKTFFLLKNRTWFALQKKICHLKLISFSVIQTTLFQPKFYQNLLSSQEDEYKPSRVHFLGNFFYWRQSDEIWRVKLDKNTKILNWGKTGRVKSGGQSCNFSTALWGSLLKTIYWREIWEKSQRD